MSFQLKDFQSIVAAQINHMRGTQKEITDFNVGSVARTLVEASAIEIDELYQQMFHGLREAVPVSVYNSFDFTRLPAIGANGLVRFSVAAPAAADIAIPAGTVVRKPGGAYDYATSLDAVIAAGTTEVDVLVYCTSAGATTNVAAGLLTEMVPAAAGVACTNLNAFTNGQDIESDTDRKIRFNRFISTIARGTGAALDYGARTTILYDANGTETERVNAVNVVEPYLLNPAAFPPALVWLYIHNGSSGTSLELVQACQQIIDGYRDADQNPIPGWKAAGVTVEVIAATDVVVDIDATIEVLEGYDAASIIAQAGDQLREYINGLGIGAEVVQAELVSIAMEIPGVYNIAFVSPGVDLQMQYSDKPLAGTVLIVE